MARSEHQPSTEAVKRPERTREEMREMCGGTAAVILATETATTPLVVPGAEPGEAPVVCRLGRGGKPAARPLQLFEDKPLVAHALRCASMAQVDKVFVLVASEIAQDVSMAVHALKRRRNDPPLDVLEVDASMLLERTRASGDIELFDVPFGVLEVARTLAGEGLQRCEAVFVMRADMPRVTADHLFELCEDWRAHPGTDVVASWIQWLRRPPYLFATDFLDELAERAGAAEEAGATRGVQLNPFEAPRFSTRDHVFGEEQLAATDVSAPAVEAFFKHKPMAALQAVELARYAAAHEGEPLYSPNQQASLMGPAERKPLEGPDRILVERARDKTAWAATLDERERAQLAWADSFGARNKRDFPLLCAREHAGKLVYLDSAATTQRVDTALQAQRDFDVHENANVYRGGYPLSANATFSYNDARARLEAFIGAKRRSVAFTANTTAAVNLVAQAWGEHHVGAGDVVVTTLAEHHSTMLPFLMLAQRKGAQVVYVPYDENGRIDQGAYAEALSRGPKLVALAHIGNVFGIEAPVADMARAAHEAGARILVDAAQSFPHKKLDVEALGADWLALSAHKAYGPMGLGALWISEEAFDEMDPLASGGGAISHVSCESYYLRTRAIQYELGTPPVSQAMGFAGAIDYLDALGMGNVERHAAVLTRYAVRGLSRIEGVHVVGDHTHADGMTGLVSFTVRSVAPAQLAAFLGRLGVAIRSGGHCALPLHAALGRIGTGRISIGVHTTRADIDAALVAVEMCRIAYES